MVSSIWIKISWGFWGDSLDTEGVFEGEEKAIIEMSFLFLIL